MEILTMLVCFVLGAAAVVRGVWLLSPACAWITAGAALLFVAAWPVIRARRQQ